YCEGFFFQAEDGIRDFHVTGVQTCALPISPSGSPPPGTHPRARSRSALPNGKWCRGACHSLRWTRRTAPGSRSSMGRWGRGSLADRKSTRLNSSHVKISYAVFCLKKKNQRE